MMKKDDTSQLEMFSKEYLGDKKINTRKTKFLNIRNGYEKVTVLIISYLVVSIIAFSLGVKRGQKGASIQPSDSTINTASKNTNKDLAKEASPKVKKILQSELKQKKIKEKKSIIKKSPKGMYAIQVASFKKTNSANKEMSSLKEKDFKSYVVNKGEYLCVFVGNFYNKKEAKNFLKKLKQKYDDCFIRKL